METDTRCPVCWVVLNEDGGSLFHEMQICYSNAGGRPYSKVIGSCYFRNFDWWNLSQSWIKLWVTILPLSDEICLKVVMMLYPWWEARNKANAGGGARQTSQVLHRATMLAIESMPSKKVKNYPPRTEKWARPPPAWSTQGELWRFFLSWIKKGRVGLRD